MKEIAVIVAAKNHKAFKPLSEHHKKFLLNNLEKVQVVKQNYPYIDLEAEEQYFLNKR